MQNSQQIKFRKYFLSPKSSKQAISFFTPRDLSNGLNNESEHQPSTNPFKYFQIGTNSRLKPVSLKTPKKCSLNNSKSSDTLRQPELHPAHPPISCKHFLPSLTSDSSSKIPSKKPSKIVPNIFNFRRSDLTNLNSLKPKPSQKIVKFSDETLEVSFGNSGDRKFS